MTPKLEAALTAIQPLSSAEHQQLLQILTQDKSIGWTLPTILSMQGCYFAVWVAPTLLTESFW